MIHLEELCTLFWDTHQYVLGILSKGSSLKVSKPQGQGYSRAWGLHFLTCKINLIALVAFLSHSYCHLVGLI